MSSTFEIPGAKQRPANGQAESRIIHFDATERRREKMRRSSSGEKAPAVEPTPVPKQVSAPVVEKKPAPAAETKSWSPAPASAVNAAFNGNRVVSPALTSASHSKPASAPPAAHSANSSMNPAALEKFLIGFVVEQTGYPAEMVELDADLEADLGIDSIKKAQLFGELAEHFEVTASATDLSLDDFPTLRHVLNFLKDKPAKGHAGTNGHHPAVAPAAKPAPAAAVAKPAAATPVAAKKAEAPKPVAVSQGGMQLAELEKFLINFVVEQTGYPAEMVELDADLEADLGIDSIKKAQLFGELAEHFEVTASATDLSLDDFPTLRHVVTFLSDKPSRGAASAPATAVKSAAAPVATSKPAVPAATPVAVKPPAVQAVAEQPSVELEKFLINFVVEQTGYPEEMVELDADLEADLGIDSIKKAQLFGELAEHFEVTTSASDLSLDDFPTLRHVLNFLAKVPRRN